MDFTRHHPGMRLQLNLANPEHAGRVFDAADLTLCVGEPPVSSRVAHHLGFVSGGLYAAEAYLAARANRRIRRTCASKIASASGCAPMVGGALAAGLRRRARRGAAREPFLGQ